MPFTHDVTVTPAPAALLETLTDEEFVRAALADLGADVREVTVGRTGTTARYSVPTRGIPPMFARFVGERVEVTDVRSWSADEDGTRVTGTVEVSTRLFGRDVRLTGERRIEPSGTGSRVTSSGRSSVDAPLVGRQAEGAVDELAVLVLRAEAATLQRRVTG